MAEQNYTVAEVATLLRLHPRTVRRMIERGEIAAFTVGLGRNTEYRISLTAINAFKENRRVQPRSSGSSLEEEELEGELI